MANLGLRVKMRVKLEDVCDKGSSNLKQSNVINKNGSYSVYGASGYVGSIDTFHQSKPYVAVVKDGAGIGRAMLLPEKTSVIGTMQYLLPKDNILPEYLYYVLKAKHLEKYFSGATIPHIYFKNYKNEEFELVSFDKQKEIISRIKMVESIIEKLSNELNLLDELVKARFVEMFRNINEIDSLGNLMTISRGASPRPISKYVTKEDGVNWIKIGDVSEQSLYITKTKEKITYEGAKKSRKVHKGDFILSNSMSFGRPYILGIDGCVHDGWLILSDFKDIFNELYLYYAIRSDEVQYQFTGKVNGATVKNLNSDLVKSTYVKIPPLSLQNQFADFVRETDKSRLKIQKSLESTQELFDSLMQKYFG